MLVVLAIHAADRFLLSRRNQWRQAAFLALCSLFCSGLCVAMWLNAQASNSRRVLVLLTMLLISAAFAWGALGTAFGWAGFREPDEDEDLQEGDLEEEPADSNLPNE